MSTPAPLPNRIEARDIDEGLTEQSKRYYCLKLSTHLPLSFYPKADYNRQSNGDLQRSKSV